MRKKLDKKNFKCPGCGAQARRFDHDKSASIFVCTSCKLEWANILGHGGWLINNENTVHQHYMAPWTMDWSTYKPYLDFWDNLEKMEIRPPFRLLDIGCGNGAFVRECLKRGIDAWGVDADDANRNRQVEGVYDRILFSRAEELPEDLGQFDLVTFWDSFEHIPAPFALLNQLRKRLVNGATIFIRVNNSFDIYNLLARGLMWTCPVLGRPVYRSCFGFPQHYWNFNPRGVSCLSERHGWKIVFHRLTETPADRLFAGAFKVFIVNVAYAFNRLIRGGKIGEYFLKSDEINKDQKSHEREA